MWWMDKGGTEGCMGTWAGGWIDETRSVHECLFDCDLSISNECQPLRLACVISRWFWFTASCCLSCLATHLVSCFVFQSWIRCWWVFAIAAIYILGIVYSRHPLGVVCACLEGMRPAMMALEENPTLQKPRRFLESMLKAQKRAHVQSSKRLTARFPKSLASSNESQDFKQPTWPFHMHLFAAHCTLKEALPAHHCILLASRHLQR